MPDTCSACGQRKPPPKPSSEPKRLIDLDWGWDQDVKPDPLPALPVPRVPAGPNA
jgi:hypothetical protein